MGRKRKIDPEGVLDAAERVVLRRGAAGLSIDAVAKEAGIAKSSVLYDYKTKGAVLEALVARLESLDRLKVDAAVAEAADTRNPALFGRVNAAAAGGPSDDERAIAVAVAVAASASDDKDVQGRMRDWLDRDLKAIRDGSDKPSASLIAFLALYGLSSIEYQGLSPFDQAGRAEILDGVRAIFNLMPEEKLK